MKLIELARRFESGNGPDEALEAEVWAATHDEIVKPYPPSNDFGPHNRWQFYSSDGKHFLHSEWRSSLPLKLIFPRLTSSIDEALDWAEGRWPFANIPVDGHALPGCISGCVTEIKYYIIQENLMVFKAFWRGTTIDSLSGIKWPMAYSEYAPTRQRAIAAATLRGLADRSRLFEAEAA